MTPLWRTGVVLAAMMFAAAALAYAMKPTNKLADLRPRAKLETLLPMQFGDWHGMPADNVVLPDPQMAANLARIYTEIISRTYADSHGRQIMLSIAYGDDQRDGMNVHYPEVCYPAQGFQTRSVSAGKISTTFGAVHVKRLEMVLGQRQESVTYWTMVGERQSIGRVDKKLIEIRYSFEGVIPDGLLFRVSSIERDAEKAHRDHEEFVVALLGNLNPETRKRLAGL